MCGLCPGIVLQKCVIISTGAQRLFISPLITQKKHLSYKHYPQMAVSLSILHRLHTQSWPKEKNVDNFVLLSNRQRRRLIHCSMLYIFKIRLCSILNMLCVLKLCLFSVLKTFSILKRCQRHTEHSLQIERLSLVNTEHAVHIGNMCVCSTGNGLHTWRDVFAPPA